MKKTGVILTAIILLCALLISCGTDNGVLPPESSDVDTSTAAPVTTQSGEVDAIVPQSADQTEELVFQYLSALPTVGEDTPEPQVIVVQSYEQLRAVYEAAVACEDDEMGVKGSWKNIGSSDKFYQTYFDKHFAVVVLMVTDDGYYDLRLDLKDSDADIGLDVFGMRSYEQPVVRERHVLFGGFEGKYEGQSISLDVSYTPYASQIEQNIQAYFSSWYDWIPSKPYFVVQSYEQLLQVYECASQNPRDYGSYSLGIKGNWSEAKKNNLYNEQFFENNYIVVAMTQTESGSYTFTSSAEMVDGEIAVTLNGVCPWVSTTDIGAYLFVCPMQGEYGGESINIVRNTERETSSYTPIVTEVPEITVSPSLLAPSPATDYIRSSVGVITHTSDADIPTYLITDVEDLYGVYYYMHAEKPSSFTYFYDAVRSLDFKSWGYLETGYDAESFQYYVIAMAVVSSGSIPSMYVADCTRVGNDIVIELSIPNVGPADAVGTHIVFVPIPKADAASAEKIVARHIRGGN